MHDQSIHVEVIQFFTLTMLFTPSFLTVLAFSFSINSSVFKQCSFQILFGNINYTCLLYPKKIGDRKIYFGYSKNSKQKVLFKINRYAAFKIYGLGYRFSEKLTPSTIPGAKR